MEILIGKLQDDGMVKYISVAYNTFGAVKNVLCVFYKKEKRVDDLIRLGNLRWIGPSPYGKYKGNDDECNCYAEWRDAEDKRQANKHKTAGSRTSFIEKTDQICKFLYENGQWTVIANGKEETVQTVTEDILIPDKSLKNYEIKELLTEKSNSYNNSPVARAYFNTWKEMISNAVEKAKTYYVFSQNKLVTVINPPQTPQTPKGA